MVIKSFINSTPLRFPSFPVKPSNMEDAFVKDMPKSMKLKLKGGAYVDPESNLDHKTHVFKKGEDAANAPRKKRRKRPLYGKKSK